MRAYGTSGRMGAYITGQPAPVVDVLALTPPGGRPVGG